MNRFGLILLFAAVILPASIHFGEAGTVTQLTDLKTGIAGPGALDDAGTTVYTGSSTDQLGTNPRHAYQIFKFDAVTGAGTQVTSTARGVTPLVSVSDDGVWLAFVSPSDLTGGNHDLSPELYVMQSNGTQLTQLTSDPAVNAGSVSAATIAGNGLKIAFVANTNPLGTNPTQYPQLFVINRDGSGLRQLTSVTTGSLGGVSISDDGTRLTFTDNADLTGGNADLSTELFAINGDGTGLRQLTNVVGYNISAPTLAGGGARIAFQTNADLLPPNNVNHRDEIFIIDWLGTGLRQLTRTTTLLGTPAAQLPSITDDGVNVFFMSNHVQGFTNFDSNYEIWRIKNDGTGLRALTTTAVTIGCVLPTVSGNGTRVAFYYLDQFSGGNNPDGSPELHTMDGNGGGIRQLTFTTLGFNNAPSMTADASRVVFINDNSLLGAGEVYRVQTDGSGLAAVTSLSSGSAASPSIADDGISIVFDADSNPTGGNLDASGEIFFVRADGSGLLQLTNGPVSTTSENARIAGNGSVVVFQSAANLTGGNADGSLELLRVNPDGSGLLQLTNGAANSRCANARMDATGTWVVFESNADLTGGNADLSYEVFRVRTDATGLQQLTSGAAIDSRSPDVSGDGRYVVYQTTGNPLGTNPEANTELFVFDTTSSSLTQLTSQTVGSAGAARISRDGAWVWFSSDSPIAETDPDTPADLYRIARSGGAIERVGALRAGGGGAPSLSSDGQRAAFSGLGDFVERNPDLLNEIFFIDRNARAQIRVTKALPTVVSWDLESGPARYDVIRGDVDNLAPGGGATVSLGAVVCLENDSADSSTAGSGDAVQPSAGHAFFYLYRGSAGLNYGAGSFGAASNGSERVAGSGVCAP